MAFSISCCLRPSFSPPPPPPPPPRRSPLNIKTTTPGATPWPASKGASWGRRCVATTAACIIIGSSAAGGDGATVFAGDLKVMGGSEGKVLRWSDKRKCPPWHVNSLEKNVPENLPRPWTSRRSSGTVAYETAPPVGGANSIRYKSSCYSL